ncbi:MAG: RES family NAD+ phosphorylase [Vicinamibacterales bacterium]
MSSATWTPAALSRERRALEGTCWRIVESQNRVSTMKLVDTLEDQALLEELLEPTKPPVPAECRHLDFLLFTPFRYDAPYPKGSRFRAAGFTPGVFYGSESADTAVAEMTFHRLLFFADAPGVPWPRNAGEYTVFSVPFRTAATLDLTAPPLAKDAATWTHPTSYGPCQALAGAAREAGMEVLRYASARVGSGTAVNLALLTCGVFAARRPAARQTWRLLLGPQGARAVCERPRRRLQFDREAFGADPRIRTLDWDRDRWPRGR